MRKTYRAFFIAFSLLVIILLASQFVLMRFTDQEVALLDTGWSVTRQNPDLEKDITYTDVNPEKLRTLGSDMRNFQKTDTLTLIKTLEDVPDTPFLVLFIDARNAAVEVFLDDEKLTDAYMDAYETGALLGGGDFFVDLPEDVAGKALTLIHHPGKNRPFTNIIAPYIGNFDDLSRAITYRTILPFFMGIFLIIYGMGMSIMMTLYITYLQRFEAHVVTGMLCIVLGGWILTRNRLTIMVAPGVDVTLWEHVFLYLIIPMLYVQLTEMPRMGSAKRFYLMAGVSTVSSLLFIILGVSGIVPITAFEVPFYLLAAAGTALVVTYLLQLRRVQGMESSEGVRLTGINVMSVAAILAIVGHWLGDYFGIFHAALLNDIFPVGAAFYVMAQMVDYFIFVTSYYAKKEENTSLLDIAYVDELTGLANRAEWDTRMEALDEKGRDYCILSMDLNGLKEVNDTMGHAAGDRLLQGFARVVKETFRDGDFCARIGGDEFVVIMEDISGWQIDTYLKYLDRKLSDLDRRERGINHSCACGYAFKKEADDAHGVYLLADGRMYERKAIQKGKKVV